MNWLPAAWLVLERALALPLIAALPLLGGGRLVLGRHAAHCVGDPAAGKGHAVVCRLAIAALRQAELQQRRVEQVAGVVPGEGPSGAVRALEARGETDDQEGSSDRPEGRNGSVMELRKACAVGLAESREPRAELAIQRRFLKDVGHGLEP